MSTCSHQNVEPWDCGCLYGCNHCSKTHKCRDCGVLLRDGPKKAEYEGVEYPSVNELARKISREQGIPLKEARKKALRHRL